MTKISNTFSGWFQRNVINNYKIFRRPFKVNPNWLNMLHTKHYTDDIQSKFNPDLFIDQDRGKAQSLLNEIKFNPNRIRQYENELRILNDWLDDFPKVYKELKDFLFSENISINTNTKQFEQLELLDQNIPILKKNIEKQKTILSEGINSDFNSLPKITFDYDHAIGFDIRKIDEYDDELKFINQNPSEEYPIAIVFRRQSEILNQIRTLNSFNIDFFNRIKIIHGKAGMGKSNISAYLTTTLKNENHPVILIKAKSFNGSADEFNRILMEQLLVPDNYTIEEVLKKINNYGKNENKRVVLIVDGLNETTTDSQGFSKIWENNFDGFVELLLNYKYIYFISTLRTSYITRIWSNGNIPLENLELTGFKNFDLRVVVEKYFNNYNIKHEGFSEQDIFYFKTPLLVDLYCQMLNPNKEDGINAIFGLNGFKDVFEKYISNLSERVRTKLTLGTVDQVKDGIDRCSSKMLENLEANIPKVDFYSIMENQNVVNVGGTIGEEILSEYLIYLDENHNGRDVIIHTQQEVGGYLLAKKLISESGNVNSVVNTDFYKTKIVGTQDPLHQLKDDILKFLLIESNENSIIFDDFDNPIIKKFTVITLQTEKNSNKTEVLKNKLDGKLKSKEEIGELLIGFYSYFFEPDSPLNFNFIKSQLQLLDSNVFEYTWTRLLYENYDEINELIFKIKNEDILIEKTENKDLTLEFLIWTLETTIRELRDKVYLVLLDYFKRNPAEIFDFVLEYSKVSKSYIYERLVSLCYAICLINQNNDDFLQIVLKKNILKIYQLQFGKSPTNPVYNYIVIDSIKHMVDLSIFKGIFEVNVVELEDFNNYKFELNNWFNLVEEDKDIVREIYLQWTMNDHPDPLRGDFVQYTIPRLEKREHENRLINTAHIYKQIINLGYHPNIEGLSKEELKFRRGDSIYGVKDKIDRLGKKYSWLAFFDYAGYLLNEGKLDVWRDDDSALGKHYDRLGDVEIEITNPKPLTYKEKLTDVNLFSHKDKTQNWVYKPMYDSLSSMFNNGEFTLLSGFINQRESESYDSRSFLLINSFFLKKDSISGNIEEIIGREFDWKDDVITSRGSLSKVYFGELYWADNVSVASIDSKNLPLIEEEEIDYKIKPLDPIHFPDKYKGEDVNKIVKQKVKKQLYFEFEETQIDYLWESNSKGIPTVSSTIPNTNIGNLLELKADTSNLQLLDKNNILAYKSFEFEENYFSQNFEYLRTDLLNEYMEMNDYLLVYQVKQHTYDRNSGDGTGDFRGMQFFLSSLNK